jgi:hypothetical protein
MPADLFCDIDGVQHGPLTVAQLKQLADEGALQPSHGVWRSGMHKKVPASTIRGLFDDAPVAVTVVEDEDDTDEKPAKKTRRDREEEEVEEEEVAPEPEPELLAEMSVTYREGLPDVEGPLLATLYVESTRLRFSFDDEDEEDWPISFEKIENVLEPARGDFPQAMKKSALAAKVGGKVGKLAAGLFGQMIGGDAGAIVEKVGGGASGMAEKTGDLGKPPRNRITVIARLRKVRCKVRFDANGDNREDMNTEAKALYRHISKARARFGAGDESPDYEEVEDDEERIPLSGPEEEETSDRSTARPAALVPAFTPAPLPAPAGTGKLFRVMRHGHIKGPFSLEELRALFASGKLRDDDMIGVETWLPFATLGGLVGSCRMDGASKEAHHAAAPLPANDSDAIPVDDEFKL